MEEKPMENNDKALTGETLAEAYKNVVLALIQNPDETFAEVVAGYYWTDGPEVSPRKGIQIKLLAARGAKETPKEKSLIIT